VKATACLVLDLRMPKIDGLDNIDRFRPTLFENKQVLRPKSREIDLGVDRGGGWVAVPEKVPDHLHRHALIQKMLGCGVP
jgi:hypothetical protein